MNQEELALFIELQSRLLEYRGEWQDYDEYYCTKFRRVMHVDYHDTPPEGPLEPCCPDAAIWIPKVIDPADPERVGRGEKPRGLWGMVDWGKWRLSTIKESTQTFIACENLSHLADTPTLALLKALEAQWKQQ